MGAVEPLYKTLPKKRGKSLQIGSLVRGSFTRKHETERKVFREDFFLKRVLSYHVGILAAIPIHTWVDLKRDYNSFITLVWKIQLKLGQVTPLQPGNASPVNIKQCYLLVTSRTVNKSFSFSILHVNWLGGWLQYTDMHDFHTQTQDPTTIYYIPLDDFVSWSWAV